MPLKDKQEYNEYMRNKMQSYRDQRRAAPKIANDFNPSEKEVLDLNKAADIVNETKNLLKNSDSPQQEEDPILKAIEKYSKYLPLVMQFVQGFQQAAAAHQPAAQQQQSVQPPPGWLNMTPMQRMAYKYTRAEWYAAGERYEEFATTGQINPAINTAYVDPTYDASREQRRPIPVHNAEPQNLAQLSKKYGEPPLVQDAQIVEQKPADQPKQDQTQQPKPEEQIIKAMQDDNAKYLKMGIDYVNKIPMDSFKVYIATIDTLIQQAKGFKDLLPVHVKAMIVQTSADELIDIFKQGCPEKYAYIEKEKKIDKIKQLYDTMKKELV